MLENPSGLQVLQVGQAEQRPCLSACEAGQAVHAQEHWCQPEALS